MGIAATYGYVTGESLTPDWDGDAMSPECGDSIIDRYACVRRAGQADGMSGPRLRESGGYHQDV